MAEDADPERFDVREVSRPPAFVPADRRTDDLLRDMQERRVHLAIVVEGYDVVGIVTLEDIIEELIGEVYDEHDLVSSGASMPRGRARH